MQIFSHGLVLALLADWFCVGTLGFEYCLFIFIAAIMFSLDEVKCSYSLSPFFEYYLGMAQQNLKDFVYDREILSNSRCLNGRRRRLLYSRRNPRLKLSPRLNTLTKIPYA